MQYDSMFRTLSTRDLFVILTTCCVLMAFSRLNDTAIDDWGKLIKAFVVIVSTCVLRAVLTRPRQSTHQNLLCMILVLAIAIPYCSAFVGGLNSHHIDYPLESLRSVVWLLSVPLFSFFLFDFRNRMCDLQDFVPRSFVEVVLVFPAWSVIVSVLEFFWLFVDFSG